MSSLSLRRHPATNSTEYEVQHSQHYYDRFVFKSPFIPSITSFLLLISNLDTMNNGINSNAYIGNFRVQQQSDNSTSPQQMMNQMTDGFKPFYKKYE